jgi:zinc/manganese transport system substrate-binding protein
VPYRPVRAAALGLGVCGLVGSVLIGCSGSTADAPGKIDVVASTDVWGSVVTAVGGGRVAVTSILSDPDQDPHSFEAGSRTLLAVREADLLVENGGGYDDFMSQLISTSATRAPVVDAVETSGLRAPAGGDLNEHVWYDLAAVKRVANTVASRLGALAPRHAAEFTARAKAFDRRIDGLAEVERQVGQTSAGVPVGVTEPVPLYLLRAMGLRNVTPPDFSRAIEESGDVSPRVLAETLALFSQHQVDVLVYNVQTSGPVTVEVEAAARAAGVPVVPVTETLPEGTSYVAWMSRTITRVVKAVTGR